MMLVKCKKSRRDEKLDRISELPEPLIRDIMYRLPERDSARAAVLSKTWKTYCTLYPILHFDHHLALKSLIPGGGGGGGDMFMDDVDYHLSRASRLNSPIRKISLSVWIDASMYSRVDKWLELLRRVIVEDFFIFVDTVNHAITHDLKCRLLKRQAYEFPLSVLASEGLHSLYVKQCMFTDPIIKGEVSFSCLKELCLSYVFISKEDVFVNLGRSCQGVETLHLHMCLVGFKSVKLVNFPKLKKAVLFFQQDQSRLKSIDIADTNLQCFKCDIDTALHLNPAACASMRELTTKSYGINQPSLFRDFSATFPLLEEADILVYHIDTFKAASNFLRKLKIDLRGRVEVKDVHIHCPSLTLLDFELWQFTLRPLTVLYVDCPKLRQFRFCAYQVPNWFFFGSTTTTDLEESRCVMNMIVPWDTLWLINLRDFLVHIMGKMTYLYLNFRSGATFKPDDLEAVNVFPCYNVHLTVTLSPEELQDVADLVDRVLWVIRPATLSVNGKYYYLVKYLCENLIQKSEDNIFGEQVTRPSWSHQLEDFQVECSLNIPDMKENFANFPEQCRTSNEQICFKFDWSS